MLWKGFTAFYALPCNLYTFRILGHHNISYQGHNFISKYPAFEVKGGIMWHFSEGSHRPYIIILFPFRSWLWLWLNIKFYRYFPTWKYLILANLKKGVNSIFLIAKILKGVTRLVLIRFFLLLWHSFTLCWCQNCFPQNSGGPHSEKDCFYKALATVPLSV